MLVDLGSHPRLFHGIAAVCMVGALAIGLMQWNYGVPVNRFFAVVFIFLTAVAGELLLYNKRHRAAYITLIWGVWGAATVQATLRAGLANPSLYLYPVIVLMSGWLIGVRHAFFVLLASSLSLLLIAIGVESAMLVPGSGLSPVLQAVTMAAILLLCFVALRLVLKNHWSDLNEIQGLLTSP